LKVAAEEMETYVFERIQELAGNPDLLDRLVAEANERMQRQAPILAKRKGGLQKSLGDVKRSADRILAEWAALEAADGRLFLSEKLGELAQRRADLERGIGEIDEALKQLRQDIVSKETVRTMLAKVSEIYQELKPFEQKELMQLVVRRAEVSDKQITLELYGAPMTVAANGDGSGRLRSEPPNWLPR
jgi:hypothetical protein